MPGSLVYTSNETPDAGETTFAASLLILYKFIVDLYVSFNVCSVLAVWTIYLFMKITI